jgi:hypothetical protein
MELGMVEGNEDLALLLDYRNFMSTEKSAIRALESELTMRDFKDSCPSFVQKESGFGVQTV